MPSQALLEGVAQRWSGELGLALSDLFGTSDSPFGAGKHFALLDGVAASFSMSVNAEGLLPDISDASAYAWSSNLRKHVLIDANHVSVVSVTRPKAVERYTIATVESQLERFLEYLSDDRHMPTVTVVEHVLSLLDNYRQVSASGHRSAHERDAIAIQALLLDIAMRAERSSDPEAIANKYTLPFACSSSLLDLIERVHNIPLTWESAPSSLQLHASLAIRHAGGAIFQRITAALSSLPQLDLFTGMAGMEVGRPQSLRLGGYFTPPGLARSLAEAAITGKTTAPVLRICDPACGSGVFLSEVLRALFRARFQGSVHLVGRDISSTAVDIAKFVTRSAALDFGLERVTLDIKTGDSISSDLEDDFGDGFDVILMNPPYRAWEQSKPEEREKIRLILGTTFRGKPDLSLAFATRAFSKLSPDGVLATLLPIGVLTSEYSKTWREMLCSMAQVKLVGTLGDHHIFDYALVNVAALVVRRSDNVVKDAQRTMMLWANQDDRASSHALRALRKGGYAPHVSQDHEAKWRTYTVSQAELAKRSSWAPASFGSEDIISSLRARGFPALGNLFRVRQGIRTGSREAFILSCEEFSQLPPGEQAAFRPVAEKTGISNFNIRRDCYVFYADTLAETILDEENFRNRFPIYYARFILPNRAALMARPRGVKPWGLSWSRAWLKKPEPKIVSRMFIGKRQLGFAVDERGDSAVVQGYGWNPIWKEIAGRVAPSQRLPILYAYAFLFSSEVFYDMVRTVSVNIAGGQYDLAPKYIDNLPIPTWGWIQECVGSRIETIEAAQQLAAIFAKNPAELEDFARLAFSVKL